MLNSLSQPKLISVPSQAKSKKLPSLKSLFTVCDIKEKSQEVFTSWDFWYDFVTMHNHTISRYKKSYICQEEIPRTKSLFTVCVRKTSKDTWSLPSPHFSFRKSPKKFLQCVCRRIDVKVLNELLLFQQKYNHVFVSQGALGAAIGYTRSEVNKSLRRLRAYGLVRTIYRHWQPCIYKLSSLFKLKRVIVNVRYVLSALWNVINKNHTQLNKEQRSKLNNIRISCPCSYLTYDSKRAHDRKDSFLGKLTQTTSACPPPVCQRGGRVMNKSNWDARVKAIEEVSQTLDLSRYGKANLSIFPESALRHAHDTMIKSLKMGTEIKNAFAYLHELAYKATKEQNLGLNYSLFDRYNFSESEKNPLNSKKISLPQEPKRDRKMHSPYDIWNKAEEHYDLTHEAKGFEDLEKSDTLSKAQSMFGQEMALFLKRCKHNVITKAMSCSMEGAP